MTTPSIHPHLKAALGDLDPFPWQRRLFERMLADDLPRALDLPTGLGKTSVMAIWLAARACGATHLPRRLVYVVDRRAVVDQATRVAEGLADWVSSTPEVARALGLGEPGELPISTLRGQFVDNRRWLEDPSAPAIIVGTVDMIGSRLLFEGYGCSRRMRPYHAALLGMDALVVVDESHLVPPFEHLVASLSDTALQPEPEASPCAPSRVLSLSATGRVSDEAFRLDEADREHPIVAQRTGALKRLEWRALGSAKEDKLAEAMAREAWALACEHDQPQRVALFCNSRKDAEAARTALQKLARAERARGEERPPVELLVGGRRVRERQQAEHDLAHLGFLPSLAAGTRADHAFLVMTSAGEVGVDLDADHAVMDVVAWERMVQRLGRVNRRGTGSARVIVLAEPQNDKNPWTAKVEALVDRLIAEDPATGGSPQALSRLRADVPDLVAEASTPEPLRPALTRPLVEAWSMTALKVHPGRPEVGPWIRGWVDQEPQTEIAWRRFLPRHLREAYLEAAPPHPTEKLETSSGVVAKWLFERLDRYAKRHGDGRAESAHPLLQPDEDVVWIVEADGELLDAQAEDPRRRSVFTLDALQRMEKRQRDAFERRIAGRLLLVHAHLGGLSASGLLDAKTDDPALTVEDISWERVEPGSNARGPVVPFRVRQAEAQAAVVSDSEKGDGWREACRIPWRVSDVTDEVTIWLVIDRWRAEPVGEEGRATGTTQALAEHQAWVAQEAERIASHVGLAPELTEALVVAARHHDDGKAADRWQTAFSAPPGGPWAKTPGPVRPRLLEGYRHELGSLLGLDRHDDFRVLSAPMQDLARHLVAAHHGWARPILPTSGCDSAPPTLLGLRAREVALRFQALQDRFGPWQLAWLETLLRAADQRASARHARNGGSR